MSQWKWIDFRAQNIIPQTLAKQSKLTDGCHENVAVGNRTLADTLVATQTRRSGKCQETLCWKIKRILATRHDWRQHRGLGRPWTAAFPGLFFWFVVKRRRIFERRLHCPLVSWFRWPTRWSRLSSLKRCVVILSAYECQSR